MFPSIFADAPITTLSPTVGCLFPFSFPVPPNVAPWNIVTLFPTTAVSPITTPIPWSIKSPLPMVAPGCISIPVLCLAIFDISLAKKYLLFKYNL